MARLPHVSLLVAALLMGGCSTMSDTFDAVNPFASGAPKMAPLPPLTPSVAVREVWSEKAGKAGDYTFSPVTDGKAVFAAARDGTLRRIEDGRVVWKIESGKPYSGGLGIGSGGGLLAVGTSQGEVLAYSAADGKLLWTARVSSEVLAAPAVGDAGVAVRSGDNRVFLLDLLDGGRKWAYERATPALAVRGAGSPVFADRFVFVGFPGGRLVAIATANGAPVWEGTVALPRGTTELDRVADVVAPPAVDGRQICAVAFQGKVACFDMGQGGATVWTRDVSSAVGLMLDGKYLFVTDERGGVHALDRLTGSSLWKQDKLKNRQVSAPAVARGLVAVGDAEGIIHFMSRDDGRFVARAKTDGSPVRSPMLATGGGFVVQTTGGRVIRFEP